MGPFIDGNKLINDVIQWRRDKGIDNAPMQFAKINEEIGELAHELVRGNIEPVPSQDAVDAIGDILVTVIVFADIVGVTPLGALQLAYDTIKERKGETKNGQFIKENE